MTTLNHGWHCLDYYDIVRLRVGDKITCVVPAENSRHIDLANRTMHMTIDLFKHSLLASRGHLLPLEKEGHISKELESRAISREGKTFHEFHVEIISYPEHVMLQLYNLPKSELSHCVTTSGVRLCVVI